MHRNYCSRVAQTLGSTGCYLSFSPPLSVLAQLWLLQSAPVVSAVQKCTIFLSVVKPELNCGWIAFFCSFFFPLRRAGERIPTCDLEGGRGMLV